MPLHTRHHRTRRGWVAAIAAIGTLALVGAACGGHSDTAGSGEDDPPASTETTAATAAAGEFGTLDAPVCGEGDASGATDQGVTDESIKVGALSDAGNVIIPGLLKELADASEAFVAWCNAAGGINGRPIELTVRDTKLVEAPQRTTEACAEDFMLVGGGTALDATTFPTRVACGLPEITAFHNDPNAVGADLLVQPVAYYPDWFDATVQRLAADQLGDAIQHYGLISYEASGGGTSPTDRVPDALKSIGYDTVYTANFPLPPATVDNYQPYVEDMRSDGVRIFETITAPEQLVPIMSTMADVGFTPDAILGNRSQYSSALIDGNDSLDEVPVYVETIIHPFEMAKDNPPTRQFLDIMDEHLPGWSDDPKALAVEAWSSWLLFATAATACGSDLTRDCVMEEAGGLGVWDGGGLTSPYTITTDGEPASPFCAAVLHATPDGFVYDEEFTQPNEGIFNCDEKNLVPAPR